MGMVLSGPVTTPMSGWQILICGLLDSRQVSQKHSFFSPIYNNELIVTEIDCIVREGEYLCGGNNVAMATTQATKGRHVTS